MLKKFSFILFILLSVILRSYAQVDVQLNATVKATAFAYTDSIAIRWAPTTPVAWQLANKYGYYIERVTITRNNKIIKPEKVKIFNEPLKPWLADKWETLIDKNDMAAIAAQAIFGNSFETTSNYKSDVLEVINQSKEIEQRYSFALFAADLSRITARASAIGWVDKGIKKNEKYLYKIYTAIPANTLKVDTGFVFIGTEDKRDLPKPVKVGALPGDKTVLINWARNYYDDIYVAYQVEKSEDGKSFKSISGLPIINTEPAQGLPSDKFYKLDSLAENNKPYYYRVRGLTPFGDTGPPSDVLTTSGGKPFKATAGITKTKVKDNAKVIITWMFPQEIAPELKGFNILRSNNTDTNFKQVNVQLLDPEKREYVDEAPLATNYYKVQAISKYDQSSISFPNLVQLEDSIPPQAPQQIKALADPKGLIKLSWQANTESDLIGYRIFRSNYKGEEYSQITSSPIKEIEYNDTISIQTLTDKVYYKIAAIDNRFNTSAFSAVLEVARHDVVPPAPPSFSKYKVTSQGVELSWTLSPSTDVVKYELWRVSSAEKLSSFLKEFSPKDSLRNYVDVSAKGGIAYEYKLYAFDDAGLKTQNAQPLKITVPNTVKSGIDLNFSATANRVKKNIELRWQWELSKVEKINIYKASGNEPLVLYKSIATNNGYDDTQVEMNVSYHYRVQIVTAGGAMSKISDEIVVSY